MNTLLIDLQEAEASFRCGTCPGGPEEECDDQCEKHRLEYMAEELVKKGYTTKAPPRLTSMKQLTRPPAIRPRRRVSDEE